MSPAPSLPADLHYADSEQVQLDVAAIIARGVNIRRRRLLAKVTVLAAVCAITPAVVVTDMTGPTPAVHSAAGRTRSPIAGPLQGPDIPPAYGVEFGAENSPLSGPMAGREPGPRAGFSFDTATARLRVAATVPPRFGSVLAIAGARGRGGAWFTAASKRLTLFHVSSTGKVRSWPLSTESTRPPARSHLGIAVTNGGVVWIAVSATLVRFDPRSSLVTSWRLPAPRSNRIAGRGARSGHPPSRSVYSVAVSPDGNVAVAMSQSSSVQVLDPRTGTFTDQSLPSATDQPLAVGYTLSGTLGIGFRDLGRAQHSGVMLVKRSGARLTSAVAQASAVTGYGQSGLLVGTGRPDVVSSAGKVSPLVLPTSPQNFANDTTPPVPLPGHRLGLVLDTDIMTFPGAAASAASAESESELWVTPAPRCVHGSHCPGGYRQLVTDAVGDLWAVPNADPRTIELLSLR